MDMEQLIMTIIANAGESRSASMEAIEAARNGNYEEAEALLRKADEAMYAAHDAHNQILFQDAGGAHAPMTFILVHASNHMSVAEVTRDMANEFIKTFKEMRGK